MPEFKEWTRWTDEDRAKVIQMHADGVKYADIALAMNKTYMAVNGLIKRHITKNGVTNISFITKEQEDQRIDCHTRGLSDTDSAKECGLSASGYNTWRAKRGLPNNTGNIKNAGRKSDIKPDKVVLTADDVKNYNGNRKRICGGTVIKEPICIVDVGLAEKLAQASNARPVNYLLAERVKARRENFKQQTTADRSFGGGFVRC